MYYSYLNTNLGKLILIADDSGLVRILLPNESEVFQVKSDWILHDSFFKTIKNQIIQYLLGKRKSFSLNTNLVTSSFQSIVLRELVKIPYGTTCSYSDIAKRIGNPRAIRAIGRANALNPLPIIFPCHRVISKNGDITGYRGGVDLKRDLIELESKYKL